MKDDSPYQCHYCGKRFKFEQRFIKHKCKAMLREENLRTPLGQAAWSFYQDWMKFQRKRVPDEKTFLKSNYHESFNRFAAHVKKLNLPNPHTFIKLMIQRDFPPTMWTRDETYAIYMEHLDRVISPVEHAHITTDTLLRLADIFECKEGDIFDQLGASDVIELIKERKVSPWLLLHSPKFMIFFRDKTNPEQKIVLESLIRPKYWATQFQKKPNAVKMMKEIVKEMDL